MWESIKRGLGFWWEGGKGFDMGFRDVESGCGFDEGGGKGFDKDLWKGEGDWVSAEEGERVSMGVWERGDSGLILIWFGWKMKGVSDRQW